MKRFLMLVLAMVLAVSMLAGCGGGNDETVANENEGVLELEGVLCSEEPLELTIHMHFWQTNVFEDDWGLFTEAAKATNISLKGTASATSTESEQLFNTMIATRPLPDIIHGEKRPMNEAGMDGALIPLDDLIEKYAPHIKAAMDENPNIRAATMATDGNMYYIPNVFKAGPSMGFFIRQDWLDKLNLEVPTTVEEYKAVLTAFKTQDPNGNGKADEIPYIDRHGDITKLTSLWGLPYNHVIYDEENGKVSFRFVDERYKAAIKELATWYADGLIDQEFFTRKNAREETFGTNVGGATIDWFSSTGSYNDKLADQFPGFNLAIMDPITDMEGNLRNAFTRATISGLGWGISVDNKYPAETMKYFDYWFTEEGYFLGGYGIEGEDFTYDENGVAQYTEQVLSYQGGAPEYMRKERGSQEFGRLANLEAEVAGMNADAAAGFMMYVDKAYTDVEAPALSYTEEEEKAIAEEGTAINTAVNEQLQKWIMGEDDVDATWDAYVAQLEQMGMEKYLNAYQTAYERFLAAK